MSQYFFGLEDSEPHMYQQYMLLYLPDDIKADAVNMRPFGSSEYAFPFRHAQRIMKILTENHFDVLGGDFWENDESSENIDLYVTGNNWSTDAAQKQKHASQEEEERAVYELTLQCFTHYKNLTNYYVTFTIRPLMKRPS